MAAPSMLLLYRHILKAAKLFPSIKRNGIIQDIKTEFRDARAVADPAELAKRRRLAVEGLQQLEDYAGIQKRSSDWDIFLRGSAVLFCGEEFAYGFRYTKEALQHDKNVQVVNCPKKDVALHIHDAHVAVPLMSRIDADVLRRADKLKLIIQYGVGVEGIDIPAATERGVWVSNIPSGPSGNALSCAEQAIYLMLCTLRSANQMAASVRSRTLGSPIGETLLGKKVLIIGFGNIALELIPRLKPFGVTLLGVRRSEWGLGGPGSEVETLLDERGLWPDLLSMAAKADLVVLTCSQTETTRGMVNSAFLGACKPGVHIINIARGGLLDYDAVKAGLEDGKIGGLGLDVQWSEPWDPDDFVSQHPRVILTPHVGGVTTLSYRSMANNVASEVARMQQGLAPTVQLNSIL